MIVSADYSVPDDPDAVVMGVDGNGTAYLLEEDGLFTTLNMSNFEVVDVSTQVIYRPLQSFL